MAYVKVSEQTGLGNISTPETETAWPAASSGLAKGKACPRRAAPPVSDLQLETDTFLPEGSSGHSCRESGGAPADSPLTFDLTG